MEIKEKAGDAIANGIVSLVLKGLAFAGGLVVLFVFRYMLDRGISSVDAGGILGYILVALLLIVVPVCMWITDSGNSRRLAAARTPRYRTSSTRYTDGSHSWRFWSGSFLRRAGFGSLLGIAFTPVLAVAIDRSGDAPSCTSISDLVVAVLPYMVVIGIVLGFVATGNADTSTMAQDAKWMLTWGAASFLVVLAFAAALHYLPNSDDSLRASSRLLSKILTAASENSSGTCGG